MNERYLIVPEETVKESAAAIPDDPENSFARALKDAAVYREADMTPVFLLDQVNMILTTVALETWGKKLH